jgi:hypothetical protein
MIPRCLSVALILFFIVTQVHAQGLLDELEQQQDTAKVSQVAMATFKGTRLINGHTTETQGAGELNFLISHRFGRINGGLYEFFGLDQANIRLALEYGLTDRLMLGLGRSSFEKVVDGFLKYQILKQQSGKRKVPFSVTAFSSMAVNTLRSDNPEREMPFTSRLDYTYQLLIARKFNNRLSVQLMPTLVHRNLVSATDISNDLFAMGVGGRYKLTNRMSLNLEYYYRLNAGPEQDEYYNPLAIGVDIETGGHVFQLHFTNAQAMIEEGFVTETTGNFFSGDIHFGFNISRVFQLR